MNIVARGLLIVAMLAASSLARSDGIYNPGAGGIGFKDGINNAGAAAAPPVGCAVPTAPDGVVDLSQCSNAFYVAVIF